LFTGSVSRETVFHLLKQGQIFILPCTREAFGIAILEAFLMEVPVIAMQQSGAAEVVAHGKTGLLANDDEDLIRCVEELIAHPQRAASLASAAYQEVEKYQWPNIAKQIEAVYASIVDEKRSAYR
jgi:glycosyltransferase involved in cell wall biosynthesis